MKRAFPAFCSERDFPSREAAEAHFAAEGFSAFDRDDGWTLMRSGVLEAYIRPANRVRVGWRGSVVQLAEAA